ncbi:stage II sporulation protein M [Candidatus Woesearchaeota archaeon]|nr:stage II sporulation protein M [Candidatus Woesearchaeota archaeon]
MALEVLTNIFRAEKKPFELFYIGFTYSTLAIFLSLWIFKEYSSMIMVFLTVLASIPLIYSALKAEEKKDMTIEKETVLMKEHAKLLAVITFLFLGITIAFGFWYTMLPQNLVEVLFRTQTETIAGINNYAAGQAVQASGLFRLILLNNIKVMTFCVFFAFIYGFGAIFILTWNASVIGAAIGNFIRTRVEATAAVAGLGKIASYFQFLSLSLTRYLIHGIPEIVAYITAGLAGGIISMAIIRHDFGSKKFEKVLFDSSELIIIAILLLIVAAFVEVYITPVLF